jgi:hypothetical protein
MGNRKPKIEFRLDSQGVKDEDYNLKNYLKIIIYGYNPKNLNKHSYIYGYNLKNCI